ncbi:MAG: macro domain-containing protein [Chloroflexota bacterium]|nr:macro domain-containing protein [Chloroflexota bacterium]
MIEYCHGNLLEADAEALVNTVNCMGVMGKGIALQFRQKFTENFRLYARASHAGEIQLGRMFVVAMGTFTNPRYIINFPTKHHWQEQSRLDSITTGLAALITEVQQRDIRSIAIPPLGCGNGGLDWATVRPLIVQAFQTLPNVQVLLYEPQGAPTAESMTVRTTRPNLTRARALLLRLIELYRIPGKPLTKLEVQKLAYFLQVAGEPLKLDYQPDQFGPYAEKLNHVLQRLEGHYIAGYGDRTNNAEIQLLPGAKEEAAALLLNDPDAQARLMRVHRLIRGFESPAGMELLATVLWIGLNNPQIAYQETAVIKAVGEWSARKRAKFSEQQITEAWRRLQTEQWLLSDTAAPIAAAS